MQIIPMQWDDAVVQVENLGEKITAGRTTSTYGMAAFPAGVRHPAEGFSAHAGTEISFILDGEFDVETPEGTIRVGRDSLVVIPAGEPHATLTLSAGRVVYFLVAEEQE
jgi:mannose-6-phosphate isomerase-like protein (cupin superfamily)